MRIISHRGNLNGSLQEVENSPNYLQNAIDRGFDIEIDLWYLSDNYFLGHDLPKYKVTMDWLKSRVNSLWVHCKNEECLSNMLGSDFNYFWHESDKFTMTSKNIVWSYVDLIVSGTVINVRTKNKKINLTDFVGICTDHPLYYANKNS
jgi:hypothetical protein